jgi:aminobenzoyl-glutamate utilization protein B
MRRRGLKGRVVLWGCPAEELLAGKTYMARDGAFRGEDAILGWHPGSENAVNRLGGAALDSILFEFFGRTAHGAYADRGRSALDGVMLLDVSANYLREHVPSNVRMHMCIRCGGDAPNVVPAYASSWYFVRGRNRAEVDDVRHRLEACARGAAMATGTRLKMTRLTALYERLENESIAGVLERNLELFGAPSATAADRSAVRRLGRKPDFAPGLSPTHGRTRGFASSDEDSVSWLAPLGTVSVACVARGTTGHHREYSAQMKLPFAHRGMCRAAEVLAAAAFDLLANPRLVKEMRREFAKRAKGLRYDPLIPKHQPIPTVILGD